MSHKRLFIPGPSEVRPEILQELARPQIGHRTQEYRDIHAAIITKLQTFFNTQGLVLTFTNSSTGVMEAAVRNTCNKKCVNFVNGAFSKRWHEITQANGIPCDKYQVDAGKAIKPEMVDEALSKGEYDAMTVVWNETATGVESPIPQIAEVMKKYPDVMFLVDAVSCMAGIKIEPEKLGIDCVLAGVQKAFALPAGFAVAYISEKAMKKAEQVPYRGYYTDFIVLAKRQASNGDTPNTPSIPHMFALNKQMDFILAEGDGRYARHEALAKVVQDYARAKWAMFSEEGYHSRTVSCITNTRGIVIADLNKALGKEYMTISNGYGDLKEKNFRIAHMGDTQMYEIEGLLSAIERIIATNWPGK
jgi:aspartate aminotransferase-like enzyme